MAGGEAALATPGHSLVGKTIAAGRYRITKLLGSGSMGDVYRGVQVNLHRDVAIKVLRPSIMSMDTAEERFRREALALSRLHHRNTVQVLDFGKEGELSYIAMEFLNGPTLAQILKSRGRLPMSEIVEIMSQVCGALAAAHDQGILHRDIKPENIALVSGQNDDGASCSVVKVCDFGISKLMSRSDSGTNWSSLPSLTGAHEVWGTPAFMSPEQASGEATDARADIYACGVLLFLMATGREPFTGSSPVVILLQQASAQPPRPSSIVDDIDPRFEEVILRALAKKPGDRQPDARTLRSELRDVLGLGDAPSQMIDIRRLNALADAADADQLRRARGELEAGLNGGSSLPPPEELLRPGGSADPQPESEDLDSGELEPSDSDSMAVAPTLSSEPVSSSDEHRASGSSALTSRDTGQNEAAAVDTDRLERARSGSKPGDQRKTTERGSGERKQASGLGKERDTGPTDPITRPNPAIPPPQAQPFVRLWATTAIVLAVLLVGLAVLYFSEHRSPGSEQRSFAVSSVPLGAEVFVDGVKVGTTPYDLVVPVGQTADIEVRAEGYEPCVRLLKAATPAGLVECTLPAISATGAIIVDSEPRGAEIWINGVDTGHRTPAPVANLDAGRPHRLDLVLPAKKPVFYDFMVERDQVLKLSFKLEQTTDAFLVADCPLFTCNVTINGTPSGATPLFGLPLPADRSVVIEMQHDGEVVAHVEAHPQAGQLVRAVPAP